MTIIDKEKDLLSNFNQLALVLWTIYEGSDITVHDIVRLCLLVYVFWDFVIDSALSLEIV